jgi:hypothetical protein
MISEFLVLAIVMIFVLWAVRRMIPEFMNVAAVLCALLIVLWLIRWLPIWKGL